MIEELEQERRRLSLSTEAGTKARLGQFLTPASTARFMAGLFPEGHGPCRLLDAGAGIGSLSAAFLDRWADGGLGFSDVELHAFECDPEIARHLGETVAKARLLKGVRGRVVEGDFIEFAVASLCGDLFSERLPQFTHAILNPPYKKIRSDSPHRAALRRAGIEAVNLYSAFIALAVDLAAPGGQIVAIVPRSFCNGPYYRPFREFLLERAAIHHLHLFDSRRKAFREDDVLQENVIVRLERDGRQGAVTVSTSADDSFADLSSHAHPFDRIVFPDDPEKFIHVPTVSAANAIELSPAIRNTLTDLRVAVSTGPVVDFRLKTHLRPMPARGDAPMLYPCHFTVGGTNWPIKGAKKPNAIARNPETEKWLYPNGFYCVVRRFSSKEEKRRIVASVVEPAAFGGAPALGFENHLNVFHDQKRGLPEALARGLAVYLNATALDEQFRRFNGHTQVNATDLRMMKYPNRKTLIQIGEWAKRQGTLVQEQIDAKIGSLIA